MYCKHHHAISATTFFFFRYLDSASGGASKDDICVICRDALQNPKKLKCGHVFCTNCVETALTYDNRCPVCKEPQGVVKGNQPDGQMHVYHSQKSLPGYRGNYEIVTKVWDPLRDLRTILGPLYINFCFSVDVLIGLRSFLKMFIFVWDNYINISFGISLSFGVTHR